ncbi:MAG TPA: methionine adenosyltransferase [Nanoarchaeota archaeon]|nr:methionine adenosyltransferase [Nanoarchaeota archaeon]
MANIEVESLKDVLPNEMKVEMVERKGIGHPDTLADGIAENISRELCKEYLKKFGVLMHHNTDQGEIIGGEVRIEWGGGEIIRPIYVILSGRATDKVENETIPVHEIAVRAAKEYLENVLPNLDIETGVVIESRIGRGSEDLVNVFKREKIPLANDTSFGVGFAPYTALENLVLKTEEFLNSKSFKKKFPFVGEDIKVMGLRIKEELRITIAAAMISKYFKNANEYISAKREVEKEIKDFISGIYDGEVEVFLNTADNEKGKNVEDFYLTLSGTSAEMGDDGSVGRGNRASGLITPCRPMSMEACAGKNPYNHVGKIYNVLAFKIASRVYEEAGAENAVVKILSQIGKPINQPKILSIQLRGGDENKAKKIAEEELERITELTKEIIEGKYRLF